MDVAAAIGLTTGIAAVVLAAAGIAKLVDPSATARTLDAIGLRGAPAGARTLGAVETGLALWLLVGGARWAALACAAAYLALTGAVVTLRRRSPTTPCGCFGHWSGPPARRHVVINLAGATSCILAAATGAAIAPAAGSAALGATVWWLLVAVGAVGVILALTGPRRSAEAPATPTSTTGANSAPPDHPTPKRTDARTRR